MRDHSRILDRMEAWPVVEILAVAGGIAGLAAAMLATLAYAASRRAEHRALSSLVLRSRSFEDADSAELQESGVPLPRPMDLSDRLLRMENFQRDLYSRAIETSKDQTQQSRLLAMEISRLRDEIQATQNRPILSSSSLARTAAAVERSSHKSDVTREISHALKTPLARIDAILEVLGDTSSPNVIEQISSARSALQVCHYFLDAFRSLSFNDIFQKGEVEPDLYQSVLDAARAYATGSGKNLSLQVVLPNRTASIQPYYAVAVLMPLIENAVEASPPGSEIQISGAEVGGRLLINVKNRYEGPELSDEVYRDGFSTKTAANSRSNEGLGLGISQNLLNGLDEGTLTHRVEGGIVIFTVSMRAKHNGSASSRS